MPWEKNFDVDAVLDRAMQIFWKHGYEATSMQDLVSGTGVNRGSLYATYGDKHSLFVAALKKYHDRMCIAFLAEAEAHRTPLAAIRYLFDAHIDRIGGPDGNRGCFITNSALELAPHDPEVGGIVAHAQAEMEAFVDRMVRRAQADGDVPPHIDPTAAARGLLASLIGLVVLTRSRPDAELLRTIAAEALRRLG